jgi:transposase
MNIAVVGIDLGKNSCNLGALDDKGAVVKRRRMRRESIAEFTAKLAPCIVAMEARRGAHRLARRLKSQGPEVRLMSPEYGRPCVKARKNDERDAEAIAEAATRPTMRFVAAKREEQLDTQTLHRARDRLVSERTALINQIRAIVWERGIVLPQGRRPLERELTRRLDASAGIARGDRMLVLIEGMRAEWRSLDERITAFDDELAAQAKHDDRVRRLLSVPGIGVMNATALVAALGNGEAFEAEIWRPGWGLFPSNERPAASRSLARSPSAATAICGSR